MKRFATLLILTGIVTATLATAALATPPVSASSTITVDGIEYGSYQSSGPVFHFNTPYTGANPSSASTPRNTWNGVNGADHLPCVYGYHWIDNANLLTISHCLEGETTTTTSVETTTTVDDTTTTSVDDTTTTTVTETTTTLGTTTTTTVQTTTTDPEVTTTVPEVTTTVPEVTTTVPEVTTTVVVTTTTVPTELPFTGPGDVLAVLALIGGLLVMLGGATLFGIDKVNGIG